MKEKQVKQYSEKEVSELERMKTNLEELSNKKNGYKHVSKNNTQNENNKAELEDIKAKENNTIKPQKNKKEKPDENIQNKKSIQSKGTEKGNMKNNKNKSKNKKYETVVDEITINVHTNGPKKKKKKKNKILKFMLVIIAIAIASLAILFVTRMNENGWTKGGFVATILGHDSKTLANLPRVNVLLIGQSQNLTDTLLICSYDPKIQDAVLFSIPRDTFVGNNRKNASAYDKINAIYQINPDKLVSKVKELTELDIDYYVKVDTSGLRDLVDSIGGIYFDVPMDMDYDDEGQDLYIHVKKGYQLLDGNKAEQVVRFRHNNDGTTYPAEYGEQDIGRMKTQRAFLTEVLKQLAKPENITKIDDYIKIANNNVEANFSIWKLKDYAPYLLDFNTENIKTGTLPGVPEKINSLWFYSANKKETKKLVKELFQTELTVEQEKNSKIKINILNGTKDENNLTNLQNLLKESGYNVVSTANTALTKTTTIMNRTNQTNAVANELKDIIGVGIITNSSSQNSDSVDFTIIIGDDY